MYEDMRLFTELFLERGSPFFNIYIQTPVLILSSLFGFAYILCMQDTWMDLRTFYQSTRGLR